MGIVISDWIRLGTSVRDARTELGLSQGAVAEAASVSRQWVNKVESGHRSVEFEPLLRLLEALNMTLVLEQCEVESLVEDFTSGAAPSAAITVRTEADQRAPVLTGDANRPSAAEEALSARNQQVASIEAVQRQMQKVFDGLAVTPNMQKILDGLTLSSSTEKALDAAMASIRPPQLSEATRQRIVDAAAALRRPEPAEGPGSIQE